MHSAWKKATTEISLAADSALPLPVQILHLPSSAQVTKFFCLRDPSATKFFGSAVHGTTQACIFHATTRTTTLKSTLSPTLDVTHGIVVKMQVFDSCKQTTRHSDKTNRGAQKMRPKRTVTAHHFRCQMSGSGIVLFFLASRIALMMLATDSPGHVSVIL